MTATEIYTLCKPLWDKWPETRAGDLGYIGADDIERPCWVNYENGDVIPDSLTQLACEAAIVRWLGKRCGVLARGPADHDKRWIVTLTGEADEFYGPTLLHALVAAAISIPIEER